MSWLPVCAVAVASVVVLNAGQPAPPAAVTSIRIDASQAGTAAVVIESGAALPAPEVGILEVPPRIYLDFRGVTPGTQGATAKSTGPVKRVRVAVNQPAPPVTRVVIDLVQPAPHRVDAGQREQGRVVVFVGAEAAAASPAASIASHTASPAASAPSPTGTASGSHAPSPAALITAPNRPSARRPAGTDSAALAALLQLERLRPLLSSIDSRTDMPQESLQMGIGEFEAIRQTLTSDRLDPARELLVKICVLGANAASARIGAQQDEDPNRAWNAASAAAGALIMLDRASSVLQRAPVQK